MKFITKLIRTKENRIKRETLAILQNKSDRQLVDCGISRELLNEGMSAWPWRIPEEQDSPVDFDRLVALKDRSNNEHWKNEEHTDVTSIRKITHKDAA